MHRRAPKPPASKAVFINCPFDDGFKPILRAMVFTIISSGYYPRCALDVIPLNKSLRPLHMGTGI